MYYLVQFCMFYIVVEYHEEVIWCMWGIGLTHDNIWVNALYLTTRR